MINPPVLPIRPDVTFVLEYYDENDERKEWRTHKDLNLTDKQGICDLLRHRGRVPEDMPDWEIDPAVTCTFYDHN